MFLAESKDISLKTINVLERAGIKTFEELSEKSISDIKIFRGIGKRAIDELVYAMDCEGYKFEED